MTLHDCKISDFTDVLSSSSPTPGGGGAAALTAAIGAALTSMVCSLTIGKKKYEQYDELAKETLSKTKSLELRFLDLIDEDAASFNSVMAALRMPKETEEEKALRKTAMQKALVRCTNTPFQLMRLSVEALRITKTIIGKSNPTAITDLGCAAASLDCAVKCSWLNVLINIESLEDREFAQKCVTDGKAILAETKKLSNEIYDEVERTL